VEEGKACSEDSVVNMQGVSVNFGNVRALDGIDLCIRPGEIVGLLGDNGAGKTTIVRSLTGLCPRIAGRICLNGKFYPEISPRIARNEGIAAVHQDITSTNHLNVGENFFLGSELSLRKGLPFLARKRMAHITSEFPRSLGFSFEKSPQVLLSKLTKGERQVLEIARAFYFYRSLLILDEAASSLARKDKDRLMALIRQAKAGGGSVLFVTHKVQDVYECADRFVILYGGRTVFKVRKEDVTERDLEKMLISSHISTVKEMAGGIAHQIRNPLAVMKVSAQVLKDELESKDPQYRGKIERILNQIDMIDLYVNNFFNFTHDNNPYYQEWGIARLIEEAVHMIPGHKLNMVDLKLDLSSADRTYPMVKSNVLQILINVLLYVIDVSEPGAAVRLSASVQKRLNIEIRYSSRKSGDELPSGFFYPVDFKNRSERNLGVTLFHHAFRQQHCSVEVGMVNDKERFIRMLF
jgi:ABC-type multidrug transport system ATPase subunit